MIKLIIDIINPINNEAIIKDRAISILEIGDIKISLKEPICFI